jgi:hypothetical protein
MDATKSEFKTCPKCGFIWTTREAFLQDSSLEIIGYQVNFAELMGGVFLFNHSCKTTLGLEVGAFEDLYKGPVFEEALVGTDNCPGHCLHEDSLKPCPAKCECAFAREIIQLFKTHSSIQ